MQVYLFWFSLVGPHLPQDLLSSLTLTFKFIVQFHFGPVHLIRGQDTQLAWLCSRKSAFAAGKIHLSSPKIKFQSVPWIVMCSRHSAGTIRCYQWVGGRAGKRTTEMSCADWDLGGQIGHGKVQRTRALDSLTAFRWKVLAGMKIRGWQTGWTDLMDWSHIGEKPWD